MILAQYSHHANLRAMHDTLEPMALRRAPPAFVAQVVTQSLSSLSCKWVSHGPVVRPRMVRERAVRLQPAVCAVPESSNAPEMADGGEILTEGKSLWTGNDAKIPNVDGPDPGGEFYLAFSGLLSLAGVAVPTACKVLGLGVGGSPVGFETHYVMLGLVAAFALAHSGLASLRPTVAKAIGERAYRVLFAAVSLPGAGLTISYFVKHRYDGVQLWTVQGVPGVHEAVWIATFVSFLLLYPATFNLLEVAAIKRPGFRIYETGVMRITRHPQLWGQVLWCFAHGAWLGTSMGLVASAALIAHHCFAVWNGDRRLHERFGVEWEQYARRTSVLPFRAVVDGRQKIDLKEFSVAAYTGVTVFMAAAYLGHPLMMRAIGGLQL
jgi:uncharacterized membrane protein